jgi:exodeoxyribonuclease VII small subunit
MANPSETLPAVESLSFEAALSELESIVRGLESGSAQLDAAVASYERGAALKRHCEGKLKQAEAKIQKLSIAADGTIKGAEAFDPAS